MTIEAVVNAIGTSRRKFFTTQAALDDNKKTKQWNRIEYLGLYALITFWIMKLCLTWDNWGNLTIDCGREWYVARILAEGKVLYRDVWYLYGPAAPYFNALLFRIFGIHLTILYMAGSLTALGSAIFLYLSGIELAFPFAGWSAGSVVILQAFLPTLFCFPVPYSFGAVYGCFVACLFLWLVIKASRSSAKGWLVAAGITAAVAMLLKLEHGIACYVALILILLLRQLRRPSSKHLITDLLAITPGIALCTGTIAWMLALRGVDFITQENVLSWPTSFFMKTYGKEWLARTGFTLNSSSLFNASVNTVCYSAMVIAAYLILHARRTGRKFFIYGIFVLLLGLAAVPAAWRGYRGTLMAALYPSAMVLYVATGSLILFFWSLRKSPDRTLDALVVATGFSSLLAFRMLLTLRSTQYGIYYNGPVILCHLVLIALILRTLLGAPSTIGSAERFICLACVAAVFLGSTFLERFGSARVPLETDFGVIRTEQDLAKGYTGAIAFMKEKAARGEFVLSIPEDTSLYFLSGTQCPTRVFAFTPGTVAPGKMTKGLIDDLDRSRPRYLLWSNRSYPEYGAPQFGTDFDRVLGAYFRSRYEPIQPAQVFGSADGWHATIWERKSGGQQK
jgi:hypothetical protein